MSSQGTPAPAGFGARFGATVGYYVPSALVMLGLLVVWQLAVDIGGVKEYILPSPTAAVKAYFRPNYQWTANFLATLYAVLGAFVLSAILGVVLAVIIVWNDLLMRTIMPVLVLFNTLPKIALAPLFVIWLGYGTWPNIVIGTTIAFFPMVANTAVGLATAEPELLELVRTLRASRWQVFVKKKVLGKGQVGNLLWANYGLPIYGHTYFVNTELEKKNPMMQHTIDITFAQNKPDKPVKAEDVFTNAYSSRIKPVK